MSTKKKRSIIDIMDEYFENFEEWVERFRDTLIERPSWNCKTCTIEPLRHITVTPNEAIVTVDLPYAEENAIEIKPIGTDTIEISVRMKRKFKFEDFGITHHKGEFQTLHCQTRIPVLVDMNKMEVRFKKGILEVHLPRKYEHEILIE